MIENAVKVLNELLAADSEATNEFFHLGVIVNQEVCDHPTIQVRGDPDLEAMPSHRILRPLGLLNGLIQEGNKVIVMMMDDSETTITGFTVGILEDGKVKVDEPSAESESRRCHYESKM